jgi:uncharacterized lipoprotein YmbA
MKLNFKLVRVLGAGALCAVLAGCLLKPATVTTRRFVLTPLQAEGNAGNPTQLAVGLGRITLPDYLLRDSIAIRKGENEIQYLENALWAERLDHSFQRALAANLSTQLGGSRVHISAWQPGEVALAVRVSVERLDVDSHGRGTLIARWQIESPDSGKVVRSGESSLNKPGQPPYDEPATIATTLSDLTAQFSEVLAKAVRECTPTGATR